MFSILLEITATFIFARDLTAIIIFLFIIIFEINISTNINKKRKNEL